jgi:restriction system protein
MTLVDGDELLRIISAGVPGHTLELPRPEAATVPVCPRCDAAMVRRIARQGAHAGHEFWGCSTFPTCRGTAPVAEDAYALV